jgi:hypothetical protein
MLSLCIVIDLHVAVNNIKPLSVAMEGHERVPFAMLSSYKNISHSCQQYKRTQVFM